MAAMQQVVVSVEHLSKRYQLGETVSYRLLGEKLLGRGEQPIIDEAAIDNASGASAVSSADASRILWALRDVSFEVRRGEVMGIIGRNGAGKSTLLKIMSQITEPTEGRVRLAGRVGSLLEVGTGFHPELTGRENIFLNGSILGMSKREITNKFAEIVEFSEIGRFIDTPVKRYSSGMFTRLAFAVSAHLDPEILIIDEVLSVGDVGFQKKCLQKISALMKGGRTVLFVSHNMGSISELCTSAILLQHGRLTTSGSVENVIQAYVQSLSGGTERKTFVQDRSKPVSLREVRITNEAGEETNVFDMSDSIVVAITYDVFRATEGLQMTLLFSRNMAPIMSTFDTDGGETLPRRDPGAYRAVLKLPGHFLKAGGYSLRLGVGTPSDFIQDIDPVCQFTIEEMSEDTSHRGYKKERMGHIICPTVWQTEKIA